MESQPNASPRPIARDAARRHWEEAAQRTADVAAEVTTASLVALGCSEELARRVAVAVLAVVERGTGSRAEVPDAMARFADALARRAAEAAGG